MDLSDNFRRIGLHQDKDKDIAFDIETQSTFYSQMRENDYFDTINKNNKKHYFNQSFLKYPKTEYNQYRDLKQSHGYFHFPNRKIKTFNQLDELYYEHTQTPEKRFEDLAQYKYKNLKNVYNFPYESVKKDNDSFKYTKNNISSFMAEGLPDIYNENWVGDTITDYERNILQKQSVSNDSYRFRIDSSLTNPERNKLSFQKYV
jgi:hypothetical protein